MEKRLPWQPFTSLIQFYARFNQIMQKMCLFIREKSLGLDD